MILCANINVSGLLLPAGFARTSAEDGLVVVVVEEDWDWDFRAAICALTESALSRDMPSVIEPVNPPVEVLSSASISTSAIPPAPTFVFCEFEGDVRPEILNTALSFPGPIPPRNLNVG